MASRCRDRRTSLAHPHKLSVALRDHPGRRQTKQLDRVVPPQRPVRERS